MAFVPYNRSSIDMMYTGGMGGSALQEALTFLDSWLDYRVRQVDIPGYCIAIYLRDKIVFSQSYGLANLRNSHLNLPPVFIYPICSVPLYIRVSTDEQKTDLQLMDLQDYVQRRGYAIYDTYEDVVSGATKERKALDRLVADARHRKFDIVLVWKFDRFARSLKMLVEHLELFQELGIDFISYKENIDTTTSMGRLIFHINSAYAEFERELIQDRVIAGIKAKREKTGTWGRRSLDSDIQAKIQELDCRAGHTDTGYPAEDLRQQPLPNRGKDPCRQYHCRDDQTEPEPRQELL